MRRVHPNFLVDPHNVQFKICSNVFTVLMQFGYTFYSCWLVIITL